MVQEDTSVLRPIQVTAPLVLAHRQAPQRVPGGFLGALPVSTVRPFKGPKDTLQQMADHALGQFGEQSMLVRQFTEWALREVYPKDYLGEILAIRNVFVQWSPFKPNTPLFRYINDPRHVEMVKTPERLVREIQQFGSALCDCDDMAQMAATMAMQVGREVELVALGFAPGSLSHVGVRVKEPKSGQWIWLDGVAGPREREAAATAKELLVMSLN